MTTQEQLDALREARSKIIAGGLKRVKIEGVGEFESLDLNQIQALEQQLKIDLAAENGDSYGEMEFL